MWYLAIGWPKDLLPCPVTKGGAEVLVNLFLRTGKSATPLLSKDLMVDSKQVCSEDYMSLGSLPASLPMSHSSAGYGELCPSDVTELSRPTLSSSLARLYCHPNVQRSCCHPLIFTSLQFGLPHNSGWSLLLDAKPLSSDCKDN